MASQPKLSHCQNPDCDRRSQPGDGDTDGDENEKDDDEDE